jgi:hypothetical protein
MKRRFFSAIRPPLERVTTMSLQSLHDAHVPPSKHELTQPSGGGDAMAGSLPALRAGGAERASGRIFTSIESTPMKRLLIAAAIAAPLLAAAPAHAADIGVSIEFSEPGIYGRVDLGRFPQPAVIVRAPVIVSPPRVAAPAPVYMWVPPDHRKNWKYYCRRYHACGVPVYFVRDDWYHDHVRPYEHDRGWHGHHDRDDRGRNDRDRGDHGHGNRDRGHN